MPTTEQPIEIDQMITTEQKRHTPVIVLGGYSLAGKTHILKTLNRMYQTHNISSSASLHDCLTRLIMMVGSAHFDTQATKNEPVIIGNAWYQTGRELLISLAEDVLVPVFGRELFAVSCVRQITPGIINTIECIGGDEETHLIDQLNASGWTNHRSVNIRRETEQPGVDIRELLKDAIDIQNNDRPIDAAIEVILVVKRYMSNFEQTQLL